MGGMIAKYFDVLDKNKDGALDASEMTAAQAMMGNRRRADSAPVSAPAAGGK
jgi:Ca2+-binding EF-hand superfamily protein